MGSLRSSGGFPSKREGFLLVEMLSVDANKTKMSYLTFMT
jgi:hypothetical protein